MATAELTDGTTTVIFNAFISFDTNLVHTRFHAAQMQKGRGQKVKTPGLVSKNYKFVYLFVKTATKTAYELQEELETLCEIEHRTYGYQRKITFQRPGEEAGTKTINGVITNMASNIKYGDDESKVIGSFDFLSDNISKQVP